jgi:hypothetical protein
MTENTFGTDQVLLYDVDPWGKLGFAVPSFGNNLRTQNLPWWRLAREIAQTQLGVMTHVDAMREQYVSINTLQRIGKILNRIKTVLLNRSRSANELRLEAGHSTPTPYVWLISPVPYFPGSVVQNSYLMEYNALCMIALCNIYQHSDNNLALEITAEGGSDIWQYFNRVCELIAGELLLIPKADYTKPDFLFTEAHFASYNPAAFLPRNESLSVPVGTDTGFTEDDLRPLRAGIPADIIQPLLSRYPVTPLDSQPVVVRGNSIQEPSIPGTADRSALSPII